MAHVSTYALGSIGVYLLAYFIYHALFTPLRSIPGPLFARFSRLWLLLRTWRGGRVDIDLLELHEKHGTLVRYGPYHYSFSDPEAIKVIYGHGTEFDKSNWYDAWLVPGPNNQTLFTEPSVKLHGQRRRKFQATYTMSSMVNYESFADHCIDLLCKRFEEIAKAGGETDLFRWLLSYAADTVSMITYSRRMGFLDKCEDVGGFFQHLDGNSLYATLVGIYSELHPLIYRAMSILSQLGLKSNSRAFIDIFNKGLVQEKRDARASGEKAAQSDEELDETAPKDFLSKFLDFHEDDPNRFTERDIYVGLAQNIIAGSDTTGSTLGGIFYCLLKNPATLDKLRKEIASAVGEGRLSSPPVFKEAHELPYLQAVIQESLRMYPPIGLPLQRKVPAGGKEICGHFFPAGTVVGANVLALHRNHSIWGEDAYRFRPERWLEADKETHAVFERNWAPFGLGTRTCIGKNISLLEISKLVPELVQRFDFELTHGLERDDQEMQWMNRWFVKPVSFPVKIKLRDAAR